jgi:hypothetical protein
MFEELPKYIFKGNRSVMLILIAYVVRDYSYVCGSTVKRATTVFAMERQWHPKTEENSMFASDLSATLFIWGLMQG